MLEFRLDFRRTPRARTLTPADFPQTLPFYAVSCGEYDVGEGYFTRRDELNNYMLLLTLDGCGSMAWKGQNCLLEPGSAVIIDCNIFQEYSTVSGGTWHFLYLHLGALSMEGFRGALLDRLTPVILRSPRTVQEKMEQIYDASLRSDAVTLIVISDCIAGILTEMVCSLADALEQETVLNRPDIAELSEFIRTRFYEDLHIEDFMKQTRLSRHYLIRVFERQMGMTPYRYLHMCRINEAQRMLTSTSMNVEEIAFGVGYRTPAVFIRHFKSFHGITPAEYRKATIRVRVMEEPK